jgi:hypothetical protein
MDSHALVVFRHLFDSRFFFLCVLGVSAGSAFSQTTPMPGSPAGTNSVLKYTTGSDSGYTFRYNDATLYRYSIPESKTLHGIQAVGANGKTFFPSNLGGPIIEPAGLPRWEPLNDPNLHYRLDKTNRLADTVMAQWTITKSAFTSSATYRYRVHISGRTLVIRVEELAPAGKGMTVQFSLDQCLSTSSQPTIVRIPSLPLMNLIYCNDRFMSIFFDWETTRSSRYDRPVELITTSTTARSVPTITYIRTAKPNWSRFPLNETIFLTVSPDLDGALPNLVRPPDPAPRVAEAMGKTVMFYCPPYTWLQNIGANNPYTFRLLDSLKRLGVDDLALILQWYQYHGMDRGLPDVLSPDGEPNHFSGIIDRDWDFCRPDTSRGGKEALTELRNNAVDQLGYSFAFHQNYVEHYPPFFSYDTTHDARQPNGRFLDGNENPCRQFGPSHIFKSSKQGDIARFWAGRLRAFRPTWTYLDVQSSFNPLSYADYDNSAADSGRCVFTLKAWRNLCKPFRQDGPVTGEGGFQMLFAGYLDDFDGRIMTGDPAVEGVSAPLLVDFDLRKIHGLSAEHGVGHSDVFFRLPPPYLMTDQQILTYIATEMAYGHGGLITYRHSPERPVAARLSQSALRQAQLEMTHVLPMQKAYATATPTAILYGGNPGKTATEYIREHRAYADVTSADFMDMVRVQYDNGVVVCVNRSSSPWTVADVGIAGGWFTCNSTSHGLSAGIVTNNSFTLKAENGWLCYNPLAPSIIAQPSHQTVTAGQSATFGIVAGGQPSYQWQRNNSNIPGATSSSYTIPTTVIGDNGSTYRCIVTNGYASGASNAVLLTVAR